MRRVVSNTTSLIAFVRQDRLDILKSLYGELVIPEAVLGESRGPLDSLDSSPPCLSA